MKSIAVALFECLSYACCVYVILYEIRENSVMKSLIISVTRDTSRIDTSFYPNFTLTKLFQAQKCLDAMMENKKITEEIHVRCSNVNYTIVNAISSTTSTKYYIGRHAVQKQLDEFYRTNTCKYNKYANKYNMLYFSPETMCYETTIILYDQAVWR